MESRNALLAMLVVAAAPLAGQVVTFDSVQAVRAARMRPAGGF